MVTRVAHRRKKAPATPERSRAGESVITGAHPFRPYRKGWVAVVVGVVVAVAVAFLVLIPEEPVLSEAELETSRPLSLPRRSTLLIRLPHVQKLLIT